MALRRRPALAATLLAAVSSAVFAVTAQAAPKAAIFPFDIRDVEQEGELIPQLKPDDLRRMKLVADELAVLMKKENTYEVVDLTPLAKEVEAASPFSKCDGCEVDIAKKAGADLAVTGYVDKLSDALISLQLFARETGTGKLVKSMSAEIRGNTDDLWLHGIRWLWRNRFNAAPPEQKAEPKEAGK
jgi:hypothetical protein